MPEHGDAIGIAAERSDVVAHPFQREDEIELSRVAAIGKPVRREIGVPERVEAMVQRDYDDIAVRRQACALGDCACARAGVVSAAVNIDENRTRAAERWRPDIEEEAVLALRFVGQAALWACCAERQSIGDAAPRARSLGRLKSPRRCAVADAFEAEDAVARCAAHAAMAGAGDGGGLRVCGRSGGGQYRSCNEGAAVEQGHGIIIQRRPARCNRAQAPASSRRFGEAARDGNYRSRQTG